MRIFKMKAKACKHSTMEDMKSLLFLANWARKSITATEGPHNEASNRTGERRTLYFQFDVTPHGNLKYGLTKIGLDTYKKKNRVEARKTK